MTGSERGRPEPGSDVWLGDVVTAWARAGGDDAAARAIVRCLGFDLRAPRAEAEPEVRTPSGRPPRSGPSAADPDPGRPPGRFPPAARPKPRPAADDAGRWRQLRPVGYAVPGAEVDLADVEPLARQAAPARPAPPPPLIPPVRAAQAVAGLAATEAGDGRPDIERLVGLVARRAPLRRLPRDRRPSLFRGVQLLVDVGPAMSYFRADADAVESLARRVIGDQLVHRVDFDGSPYAPGWREPYQPPAPGTPVVVLTDLGLTPTVDASATMGRRDWRRLATELGRRGSPLLALVPYPRRRWPAAPARAVARYEWEPARRWVSPSEPPARDDTDIPGRLRRAWSSASPGVRALAESAALAVRLHPGDLRELRRAAGGSLDAGDESDLWWSPLIGARSATAVSLDADLVRALRMRLRARFGAEPDRLAGLRQILRRRHAGEPPTLRLEEELVWHIVAGHDPSHRPPPAPPATPR